MSLKEDPLFSVEIFQTDSGFIHMVEAAKRANQHFSLVSRLTLYGTSVSDKKLGIKGVFKTDRDSKDTDQIHVAVLKWDTISCDHSRVVAAGTITEGEPPRTFDGSWRCLDCDKKVEPVSWAEKYYRR